MAVNPLPSETKKSGTLTCINTSKIQHTWAIHNFSSSTSKVGDALKSLPFSGGGHDAYNFQIVAYPHGRDDKCKGSLSLQLCFLPGEKCELQAKCKMNILPDQGIKRHGYSEVINLNDKTSPSINYPRFIERKVLFEKKNGILQDDVLTIVCDIIIVEGVTNTVNDNNSDESKATVCPRLHNDLSDLLESPKFWDITLISCGQEIRAHKAILAARSPVFAAMFTHETMKVEEDEVDIFDVDYDVLKEMLRYICTGKTSNLDKIANGLLMAADKYELDTLKHQCENVLCNSIAVENAVDLLILADYHTAVRLKNKALDFICKHSEDVIKTASYQSLLDIQSHLIDEMFLASANQRIGSNASEVTARNSSSDRGNKRKNQFPD